MRKLFTASLLIALVAALAASPVWAKTHTFRLHNNGSINGTELAPGIYKLELNGDKDAIIYRNGEIVARSRVEVRPAAENHKPGSVLRAADGTIREVRLDKLVVVFVR